MEHFKYNPRAVSPDVMGGLKEQESDKDEFIWVPYEDWVFYKEWYETNEGSYREYLESRGWLGKSRD